MLAGATTLIGSFEANNTGSAEADAADSIAGTSAAAISGSGTGAGSATTTTGAVSGTLAGTMTGASTGVTAAATTGVSTFFKVVAAAEAPRSAMTNPFDSLRISYGTWESRSITTREIGGSLRNWPIRTA